MDETQWKKKLSEFVPSETVSKGKRLDYFIFLLIAFIINLFEL